MNPIDIVCLAVLLVSAVFGLARGLARELLGLASWLGAGLGAIVVFPLLSPPLRGLISNRVIADAAAWAIGFIVLLIVFSVIADLLVRLVRRTPLGGIDRILGFVFGIVRGLVLVVGAYVLGCLLMPPSQWPAEIRSAHAAPLAYRGASWAVSLVPVHSRPTVAPPDPPTDLPVDSSPRGRSGTDTPTGPN